MRASTLNVPGIVGMGKAANLARGTMHEEAKRLTTLRDRLSDGILNQIDGTRLNGHPVNRLPNNTNIAFEGLEGESMILSLDLMGLACSTGSACTSLDVEPSHVLMAMGLSQNRALSSVRFSLGKSTRPEDLRYVLEVMPGVVKKLRSLARSRTRSGTRTRGDK